MHEPQRAPEVFEIVDIEARLGGETRAFPCPPEATLLDAALEAGLLVPHSCRQGHCGSCIVTLVAGTVASSPGSALSKRDRLKGRILACQSRPTSAHIHLDYDV